MKNTDRIYVNCTSYEQIKDIESYLQEKGYVWAFDNEYKGPCVFAVYLVCKQMQTLNKRCIEDIKYFQDPLISYKQFKKEYMKKTTNIPIEKFEFKAGMVIETEYPTSDDSLKRNSYIVFPTQDKLAVVEYGSKGWAHLDFFITRYGKEIQRIRDLTKNGDLKSGEVLWTKPKEVILTMEEIAEKFGVDVENLKIKK